ncbi:MAG: GGDEF domain-containing protein [Lachnospiraceae bacterium]|nr:GGDEF domain-containing protein [Lachnospiraceae bacterium]
MLQKDNLLKLMDSWSGMFSLKKSLSTSNEQKDISNISRKFADENYSRMFVMIIFGVLFAFAFFLSDIVSNFYCKEFPVSILNMFYEGLYIVVGMTVLLIGIICKLKKYQLSSKMKIALHTIFYSCAAIGSGLGYVSESLRGQRSIVPLFFVIYFGTVTTMPLGLFFFCYAAVFLPALITQGVIHTLETAEILTTIGCGLFFSFNRVIYLRFRLTQDELERVNKELGESAITDPLTKVGNRTRLYRIFETNKQQWMEEKSEICLVMCDVDNFKNYNDTYSHLKGDECLVKITEAIKNAFPKDGTFGELIRFGGEEFLIVLAGDELYERLAVMYQNIRTNICELKLKSGVGAVHEYVTLSLGADISPYNESFVLEDRIKNADLQLYISKNNGRDKMTVTTCKEGNL